MLTLTSGSLIHLIIAGEERVAEASVLKSPPLAHPLISLGWGGVEIMCCLGLSLKWEGLKRGWKEAEVERERCGPACCGREGRKAVILASLYCGVIAN